MALALNLLDGPAFNGLTIALTVASLVLAVISARLGYSALLPPKRRIAVWFGTPAAFLRGGSLTVQHGGAPVADPFVVWVMIRNTGRHDIPREQFSAGGPITLDLTVPVVEVVNLDPADAGLEATGGGTAVRVAPGLLRRGAAVQLRVLTAGEPALRRHNLSSPLVDTAVVWEAVEDIPERSARSARQAVLAALTACVVGVVAAVSLIAGTGPLQEETRELAAATAELRRELDTKPELRVTPSTVARDSDVHVHVWGLRPGAHLLVRIGVLTVEQGRADANGEFDVVATVKDGPADRTVAVVNVVAQEYVTHRAAIGSLIVAG
ncbi:hypothetical protein [Dactylosporangium sp. NPDC050588]|uniref:hypothetical protein n=1 Tax=Dactylosporangium sp. NPDC050588 TaxID=3157211 RepID=UPI0033C8A574